MNDPYSVLGVSPDASDADIKKAYRELARKYHPDNYAGNPLADLAEEKMKAINEAYDEVTKMRSSGQSYTQSRGASQDYRQDSSTGYAAVRAAISRGDLDTAESMLRGVSSPGAEWHYLMGLIAYKRGWFDEASRYFTTATSIDPYNEEYRRACDAVVRTDYPYRTSTYGTPVRSEPDFCDICTRLMCINLMCRCI